MLVTFLVRFIWFAGTMIATKIFIHREMDDDPGDFMDFASALFIGLMWPITAPFALFALAFRWVYMKLWTHA